MAGLAMPFILKALRAWAPIFISVSALAVSLFALEQSREALRSDQFYKEIAIAPVLDMSYDFNDGIKIKVTNQGAGTAVVRKIRPMKISTSKYLYETYGDSAMEVAKECVTSQYPSPLFGRDSYTPTTTVRAGESKTVFQTEFFGNDKKTPLKLTEDQAKVFYKCTDENSVQICYCSLSGNSCQTISSRGYFESGFSCGNIVHAPE